MTLHEQFGSIDIYLFDQLLGGRLQPGMSLLDAGCGGGRNLVYFLRNGFKVYGVDQSATAIVQAKSLATELLNAIESDQFRVENVDRMSFSNETFDVVLSSAVLHFANDEEHWQAMVSEMWRVLKPGGIFFARLASTVGIEDQIQPIKGRRYQLPDGSDRFLVDFDMLDKTTKSLGGEWLEPFKTVVVHNLRSMSNWCLRKM
ncbi:MAG TPA: class I SAM-dependent methyltransferase [Pyrinomonadaceae bacterium]